METKDQMGITKEKFENGVIRIENGKLMGLGVGNDASLELDKLDWLLDWFTKSDIANELDETVMLIGSIGSELNRLAAGKNDFKDPNLAKQYHGILHDRISELLPGSSTLFALFRLSSIFKPL